MTTTSDLKPGDLCHVEYVDALYQKTGYRNQTGLHQIYEANGGRLFARAVIMINGKPVAIDDTVGNFQIDNPYIKTIKRVGSLREIDTVEDLLRNSVVDINQLKIKGYTNTQHPAHEVETYVVAPNGQAVMIYALIMPDGTWKDIETMLYATEADAYDDIEPYKLHGLCKTSEEVATFIAGWYLAHRPLS